MATNSYKDENGNDWTLADLLADLDRKDNLYLTPKMCADLAQHLRQCGPSQPQVTWQAIDGDEIKTYVCTAEQAGKLLSLVHKRLAYISEASPFATGTPQEKT